MFGLSESEHSGRKRVNQIMIFTKRKSNASRELVRKRNEFTLTVVQSKQNFLNGICVTVSRVIEFLLVCVSVSYLTDSYIVSTLKMESVSKNTIFGLKMMVKSGLEKFILKSLHAGR